jgi:uncharacterized protein YjdB
MKKLITLVFCLVYTFIVFAGSVTEKQALEKARQFMPGKSFSLRRTASNASNVKREKTNVSTPYYVFNADNNGGFVIVSGDDRTKAILGYSEKGTIDLNNLPVNVKSWFNYYTNVISSLKNSSVEPRSGSQSVRSTIEPLLKSTWDQDAPYWDQCIFSGTQCYTGCVATAMAQVVNYYQYPNKVAALPEYTTDSYGYSVPALPAVTLDWKNMCPSYPYNETRTDAQKKAVATLMRYCGQAIEMDYGPDGSGAYMYLVERALVQYFGYSQSARSIWQPAYSAEDWENIIYQELAESRPVVYSGASPADGGGHAFVVDGYKNGLYHVNWGWGGYCDGHFVLTVMDSHGPDDPYWTFSDYQEAIVGIKPLVGKVKLSKTKATLEKGKTLTLKATVSPEELLDKSVTWKSSNKKVATVTSAGKVKAVEAGTATITCTSAVTGAKATCKVTVGSVTLNKSEAIIKQGKTLTLKATVLPSTDKGVTWESSNTKYVTVTADGKVKGVKVGSATVTCTSVATGLKASCQVTVGLVCLDKYDIVLKKGKTEVLTPTVYPKSLEDKSVTWKSSDTKIATVTSEGKVKGIKSGTATITCTSNATGLSRTCNVTVANITLDQYEVTVMKGKTVTLKANVYPSTLDDLSVIWESSNTKIATVTSAGKVKGVRVGTATITCTSVATGLSRTCTVTVTSSSGTRSLDGDDDDDTTGIEDMDEAPAITDPFDVYDLSGHKVLDQVTSLDGLPDGVYIVNGKKVLKK